MQKNDLSLFFVTFSNQTVLMMIDFDWNEKYILLQIKDFIIAQVLKILG